ncbi:phosphate signaling complex protein PhoU [Streptococcus merionis]|uniref:Phosphate-specific transport system accessory protein PhoU n=1 Tax=Streptococcus merionis TaxID=400065 RepID=A0A239SLR4_9STRE|nr:phosphate signaling complex protein PhoU [Streptococcus merionis]SNU86219.1 phosphate transport system regulatory protein PhoU [Streptococcus merionis]
MRERFDHQLEKMHSELVEMMAISEKMMSLTLLELKNPGNHTMIEVSPLYETIEELKKKVEARCLKLLLQQQPVARDLRRISSTLEMITDFDRIGEQILNINGMLDKTIPSDSFAYTSLFDLTQVTQKALTLSVQAYIREDVAMAEEMVAYDDVVDKAFKTMKKSLIKTMKLEDDETKEEEILDLLLIAKYFEKIADHSANAARWLIFLVTGEREGT